jgi:AcrR family transcriptional regulator
VRDRIMMAAFEEMNTRGVRFTMADLARELAISKSTIYQYFDSKDDLVEEIIDALLEDIREQEEEIVADPDLSFLQKMEALLAVFPRKFGPISERLIEETDRFLPMVKAKTEPFRKAKWLRLETLIRNEIDEGRLRPINLVVLERVYMLVSHGLVEYKFLMQNKLSAREAVAAFADILTFGLVQSKNTARK